MNDLLIFYLIGCLLATIFQLFQIGDHITSKSPWWARLISIPLWPLLIPVSFLILIFNISFGTANICMAIMQLCKCDVTYKGKKVTKVIME